MWDDVESAERINYRNISDADWAMLKNIFARIEIMRSGTRLVGNSKVMAHLLPHIIPPIDRAYTLKYLKGNTVIKNDLSQEWSTMKKIVSEFFIPIATDVAFTARVNEWIANQHDYPWDTSVFKVIDNLVIGALQDRKQPSGSRSRRRP